MIPKYSINFSWKKLGKSPRASGLLDPGFGRAGPRKNGSGGRVLQARPVARYITKVNSSLEKSFSANYGSVYLKEFPGHSDDLCLKNVLPTTRKIFLLAEY